MNRTDKHIPEANGDHTPETGWVQADPQLKLSEGRASGLQIAVVAFACMLVIGVTVYGLGRPATTAGDIMASAPPAEQTTGTAPPAESAASQSVPQTGGHVAGGENVAPPQTAPQSIPAEEPVPHLVKPGVVGSDSAR